MSPVNQTLCWILSHLISRVISKILWGKGSLKSLMEVTS